MDKKEQERDGSGRAAPEVCGRDLLALNADVFELFYNLTAAPQHFPSEEDVCYAFSTELLRYWHLCSINTFLCDEDDQLHECSIHFDEHTVGRRASEAAALLARHVQRTNRESGVWLADEAEMERHDATTADVPEELRAIFSEAGMKAAFGVPIHARENLIGVLVVATNAPQDLRAACYGVRFIATPLVIAVSNARRAAAVRAQREQIAHLDNELHQHVAALEEANRELQRVARYRSPRRPGLRDARRRGARRAGGASASPVAASRGRTRAVHARRSGAHGGRRGARAAVSPHA